MPIRKPSLLLGALLAIAASLVLVSGANAKEPHFHFTAELANVQLDGGGDQDGFGTARIELGDHGFRIEICGKLTVKNLDPVTGWSLYREGQAVAVFEFPGITGFSCSMSAPILLPEVDAIIADPTDFYVEVATNAFPDGALRGQLVADPPDTAIAPPSSAPWPPLGMVLVALAGLLAVSRTERRGVSHPRGR
jgi:hypothetical protein